MRAYLEQRTWIDYRETGESLQGYYGIGLTSRSSAPEHLHDSLSVPQDLGKIKAEGTPDFNWQEISTWNANVEEYIAEVFNRLALKPLRARFSRLSPRTEIPAHTDDYSENITRIHWPIITDEKNFFCYYSGDKITERIQMKAGNAYAVDTSVKHGFFNFSRSVERVHLIVNVGLGFSEFCEWIQENSLFTAPESSPANNDRCSLIHKDLLGSLN